MSEAPESVIRIVHASDLHLSESLVAGPLSSFKLPHRYGHDPKAFVAFDHWLNQEPWDVLVLSGDISRIGNHDSFFLARNWLEKKLVVGNTQIGLDLSGRTDRHYIVVPGNHDRFGGHLTQGQLDHYRAEFKSPGPGDVRTVHFGAVTVNFHLFDSSFDGGGFGLGRIEDADLTPRSLEDNQVDIAVLHHHMVQPPKHRRQPETELVNCRDVAAFLMGTAFDMVLFGHTHRAYVDCLSGRLVTKLFRPYGWSERLWRRYVPRWILQRAPNGPTASPTRYKRETAQDGKFPTTESYFTYLYLRHVQKANIKGPGAFRNVKQFYRYLEAYPASGALAAQLRALRNARVLVSMAPSVCQAEASPHGFHRFDLHCQSGRLAGIGTQAYRFDGASFKAYGRARLDTV